MIKYIVHKRGLFGAEGERGPYHLEIRDDSDEVYSVHTIEGPEFVLFFNGKTARYSINDGVWKEVSLDVLEELYRNNVIL